MAQDEKEQERETDVTKPLEMVIKIPCVVFLIYKR